MGPKTWRHILDAVGGPVFLHDLHYRVILANTAYCRAAGVREADALGKLYWEVFPLGAGPLPGCQAARQRADGTPSPEDVRAGERHFSLLCYTVPDDEGGPLCFLHVLTDITEQRRVEAALTESEARYRNITETTSDWAWQTDENGTYIYVSRKITDVLGYSPEEVCGKTLFDLMPPEEAARVGEIFSDLASAKLPFSFLEKINIHKDGHPVILETSGAPVIGDDGELRGYFGVEHDITRRRQLEQKVRETEARFRVIFEQSADVTYLLGRDGTFTSLSPAFETLTGWHPEAWVGKPFAPLVHPDDLPRAMEIFLNACTGKTSPDFELRLAKKSGGYLDAELSMVPVDMSDGTVVIGIARDVSERKREEERILVFATIDALTGLKNRREFSTILAKEVERAKRFGNPLSLIMCDIDHFKQVNDTLGHDVGDLVLRAVGQLMTENTRSLDVVARWGGEEFMVLLPQSDVDAACILAEKLRASVAEFQFETVGQVTLSFGVTGYTRTEDIETTLKRVDDALYKAKDNGRNRVETVRAVPERDGSPPAG